METIRKTIGQALSDSAERFPNNEALVHTERGVRYTYSLFHWEVNRVAKGLLELGLKGGDRVALWAPNIPEWVIAQMALAKIGLVLVPVVPGAGREELFYVLKDSEVNAVIMAQGVEADEYMDTIFSISNELPNLNHIIVSSTGSYPDTIPWIGLAAMGDGIPMDHLEAAESHVSPKDPVAIMYTSGTTGKPKGVVLDHLGLINKSYCASKRQGLNHQDRLSLFFPLFHMFGNTCIALTGLLTGASLVMPCLTYDPEKILTAIEKEGCTAIYGSPSMIIGLVDHPRFGEKRWKTMKKGIIGGAPCPLELMKRLVEEIGVSDIAVGYGITEASSWISMTNSDDPLDLRVSTIGTPLECNEIKIKSPLTGEELTPNSQGELCIRGFLMKGYYRKPAATSAAIDHEGWFHTGDLGTKDERGYVRITGRLKDVIERDGVEIYPTELEEIIYQVPDVSEVQVFGFPHPDRGQEVAAWVRLKDNSAFSLEALSDFVHKNVAAANRPAYLKIVSEFPMTRSGKVQKFRLAEMAAKEYL
jgi:fatty-acyl-CoA synthase